MPIHVEVLEAALRICRDRGSWTFAPVEIVRALPQRNAAAVRVHVISRCCVNAPKNHPHKWDYFRRVGRGRYEVAPAYRDGERLRRFQLRGVAERAASYAGAHAPTLHETIHAIVRRQRGGYVAECLEIAVVARGTSLDELVASLRDSVAVRLKGHDPRALGLAALPRLILQYEVPLGAGVRHGEPSWKGVPSRVVVKGASMVETILDERRRGR